MQCSVSSLDSFTRTKRCNCSLEISQLWYRRRWTSGKLFIQVVVLVPCVFILLHHVGNFQQIRFPTRQNAPFKNVVTKKIKKSTDNMYVSAVFCYFSRMLVFCLIFRREQNPIYSNVEFLRFSRIFKSLKFMYKCIFQTLNIRHLLFWICHCYYAKQVLHSDLKI